MKFRVRIGAAEREVDVNGVDVRLDGELVHASLAALEGTSVYLLTIGNRVQRVAVTRGAARGQFTVAAGGFHLDVEALDERMAAIRALASATARVAGPTPLVAPMPGLIVRVNVAAGEHVAAGQGLVVMEAMKMENELRASVDATVTRVLVQPGAAVEKGALLLELA